MLSKNKRKTTSDISSVGKSRWNILKKAIMQKNLEVVSVQSKRSFGSFKLFTCKKCSGVIDCFLESQNCNCTDPLCPWMLYSMNILNAKSVIVQQPNATTNLQV